MTKEEAISIIEERVRLAEYVDSNYVDCVDIEALRVAIKALAHPERKKGKWIKKMRVTETEKYISYDPEWYCSCCGTKYDSHIAKIVNFCYVCGADMRGEENEVD